MLDLNYLPIHFTFFLILGILTGPLFDIEIESVLFFLFLLFMGLIYLYFKTTHSFRPPYFYFIISAFIFIGFGILITKTSNPIHKKSHYLHHIKSKNQVAFQIRKILNSNNYYDKFEAEILQINNNRSSGKVLINIAKNSLSNKIKIDDILFTNNEFKEINKALNPYEFDYQDYLSKQDIHNQITLNQYDYVKTDIEFKTFKGLAYALREKIHKDFNHVNFGKNEWAIVNAILLGQRHDISKEQFNAYKGAGAIHILAVSGLHIGIILIFLSFIFRPLNFLKQGKVIKLILILIGLWVYAFIAGLSPSVIRSVTMFTAVAIALVYRRQFNIKNSLVLSIFVLLLIHPLYLFNVGFQLSYVAVFSIVSLQPIFVKFWKPKFLISRYIWSLLTVTFAAQLGVLPLSLYYFHTFPGLFFVSSLVIIPFLGIILGIGICMMVLGMIHTIPQQIASFYEYLIHTMNSFVTFISKQDLFVFQNISFSLSAVILFYLLLLGILSFYKNKSIAKLSIICMIILLFQMSLIYKKIMLQTSNEFIVFHQSKKTIIANRIGENMEVFQKSDNLNLENYSPLNSYQIKFSNLNKYQNKEIRNVYNISSKKILVIDSLGVYQGLSFNPEILILINSPRINLERLFHYMDPEIVIADGSNYKKYINAWEKTCQSKSRPFYSTRKNGAFVYRY